MLQEKKISEIVTENYSSTSIFVKYGMDFCCGGGITLKQACLNKNLDPSLVEKEILENTNQTTTPIPNFVSIIECIDYILEKHHIFELKLLQNLESLLEKLLQAHSQNHPEVIRYKELVEELKEEIQPHFLKEENILFPFLRKMENKQNLPFPIENILQPISVMEMEHEGVGKIIWKTFDFTSKFTPPNYACLTWKSFFKEWKTLIEDLQKHVFIENEILFLMVRKFIENSKRIE